MAAQRTGKQLLLKGGYECSFVEEFPKDFQSECSVCLHILREPYMVGCCGYRFCRACIQPIQSSTGHCPLCNASFNSLPDKHLERILTESMVYCKYKEDGCTWKDKLRLLQEHLKVCSFWKVPCPYCTLLFQQSLLKAHKKTCPLRPVQCKYCNEHSDTLANLEAKHYKACNMYPLPCPYNCGAKVCQKNKAKHAKTCPKNLVSCDFRYAGCEVRLPETGMSKHLKEKVTEHHKAARKLIDELRKENLKLKEKLKQAELKLEKCLQQPEMIHPPAVEKSTPVASSLKAHPAKASPPAGRQTTPIQSTNPSQPIQYLKVTNLPPGVDKSMLKGAFSNYGKVESVELMINQDQKVGRIVYKEQSSIQKVLSRSKEGKMRLRLHLLHVTPIYGQAKTSKRSQPSSVSSAPVSTLSTTQQVSATVPSSDIPVPTSVNTVSNSNITALEASVVSSSVSSHVPVLEQAPPSLEQPLTSPEQPHTSPEQPHTSIEQPHTSLEISPATVSASIVPSSDTIALDTSQVPSSDSSHVPALERPVPALEQPSTVSIVPSSDIPALDPYAPQVSSNVSTMPSSYVSVDSYSSPIPSTGYGYVPASTCSSPFSAYAYSSKLNAYTYPSPASAYTRASTASTCSCSSKLNAYTYTSHASTFTYTSQASSVSDNAPALKPYCEPISYGYQSGVDPCTAPMHTYSTASTNNDPYSVVSSSTSTVASGSSLLSAIKDTFQT